MDCDWWLDDVAISSAQFFDYARVLAVLYFYIRLFGVFNLGNFAFNGDVQGIASETQTDFSDSSHCYFSDTHYFLQRSSCTFALGYFDAIAMVMVMKDLI